MALQGGIVVLSELRVNWPRRSSAAQSDGIRPGDGPGATHPVCPLRLWYPTGVGVETPKVATTSLLGMPRLTTSSTFILTAEPVSIDPYVSFWE